MVEVQPHAKRLNMKTLKTYLIAGIFLLMSGAQVAQAQSCTVENRSCMLDALQGAADKIDTVSWQDQTYREIAKTLASDGDIDGAIAVFNKIETPDTNEAKELLKFCRKFTVPMRQAMRGKGLMTAKDNVKKPVLHLCFIAPGHCLVGYSYPTNNSQFFMGIPRLKFPSDAPSRSTLKLEEAFHVFIPRDEWDERLAPGMWGVDLGACPGGWTYQLVKRSMFVHCVDNGMMADSLMETGQIKHHMVDGFKFEPDRKNVTWIICDMVEKPARVAHLMGEWIIKGWAKEALFNLKLPMKGRYDEVLQDIENLKQFLIDNKVKFKMQAKHLYHDREEITVHIQSLSNISPY